MLMLTITPKHKIFIAIQPIDFRRGIDGIAALCLKQWQLDPLSGHFFIFRNRRGHAIKILTYDSQGWWLSQKRLSRGRFCHWPSSSSAVLTLTAAQFHVLLYNGDPHLVQSSIWQPIDDG
jgi:transposase